MRHLHLPLVILAAAGQLAAADGYQPVTPRALAAEEIAVTAPGNCTEAGRTYVLTRDISAPASALFLGKDVTLDLNGHTITYAAAAYETMPNGDFADGLALWDVSKAPTSRVADRRWLNPMVGNQACILAQGEELVSPYVKLPLADRAYYAMVALASHEMEVGIWVEDQAGKQVSCSLATPWGRRQTCPEPHRSATLGGGVVFALLFNQPAGSYRMRVKANNRDCIIAEADIRPALDTGIGVVEEVLPWAYYQCILDGDDTAFFDFSPLVSPQRALSLPIVHGSGTITIRNGTIRGGTTGIRTWGLLSTARDVRLQVENLRFIARGINANAMRFADGTITHCRTEIDSPWIIDRHRQADYTVHLTRSSAGTRILGNAFIGGQGQVSLHGAGGEVAGNLFVNRQRVVNHYSLGAGSGGRIHHNRFLPEQGSAILVFAASGNEIDENDFAISSSPPINEYAQDIYSVSAIRLTDYNRSSGDGVCKDNRIHHNRFAITGRRFPQAHERYTPAAYGIFTSVGGGSNCISDNDFAVTNLDPPAHGERGAGAFALFIGGSDHGGVYHHNRFACNDTPVWIANTYGPASDVLLHDNVFACRVAAGQQPYAPVWLGWWRNQGHGIGFYSNRCDGVPFHVRFNDYAAYGSDYTSGWTLTVKAAPGSRISVVGRGGAAAADGIADASGAWTARLSAFSEQGAGRTGSGDAPLLQRTDLSSYQVMVGGVTRQVQMDGDRELVFTPP